MSSHREAPEISKDPVADSTDVYAFVSPDRPSTVTLIANYIPLEEPAGGPNFYEFGDDVLYAIHIDTNGDGAADITYQFQFTTRLRNPDTFLYNTGPINSISSPNWNRKQFYSVTRQSRRGSQVLADNLACPPCNIGPASTPNCPTASRYGRNISWGATDDAVWSVTPPASSSPGWDPTTSHLIAEVELAEETEWGLRREALGIHSLSSMGSPVRRCDIL